MRLLEPWPIKSFRPHIGSNASGKTACRSFSNHSTHFAPHARAVAVIVFTALRALASYWQTIGFTLIGNRALARSRPTLRPVQYLSSRFTPARAPATSSCA